jgi:hypothetical protein
VGELAAGLAAAGSAADGIGAAHQRWPGAVYLHRLPQ